MVEPRWARPACTSGRESEPPEGGRGLAEEHSPEVVLWEIGLAIAVPLGLAVALTFLMSSASRFEPEPAAAPGQALHASVG